MSTLEMLMEDLKQLPAPEFEAAAAFIHHLKQGGTEAPPGRFNPDIETLSTADGDALARVIEENFERVNPRDW
jgi:hypothetical protein